MKKKPLTLLCCLIFTGLLTAQWNPQAVGVFPLYDWADQIRVADENNV